MLARRVLTLALVAGLAAACSDSGGVIAQEGPWPLTGVPGFPDDHSSQVVIVKIENTAGGRPQAGIGEADLVVQEMVEGGVTRLAVMYHSRLPTLAGPVRSLRETDIGLVLPTDGTLAASGGDEPTIAAVQAAGVPIVEEGAPGFSRDPLRNAPYNLMLDVAALSATLPSGRPPVSYFTFGELAQEAVGEPAVSARLEWPGQTTSFEFEPASGMWHPADPTEPAGFDFTNVVALRLNATFAGKDSSGAPIPTMQTEGSGAGMVLTGDRAYEVRWTKQAAKSPWVLVPTGADGPGDDFPLPPGRTWLALLPVDGGSVEVAAPEPPASE